MGHDPTRQVSLSLRKSRTKDVERLRWLLKKMTFPEQTGFADPANPFVPFGEFKTIHFARFAVLADNTLKDRAVIIRHPAAKSRPIFVSWRIATVTRMNCWRASRERPPGCGESSAIAGFDRTADLLGWLRAHRVQPLASYVNWVGRTVVQAQEEARLA